LRISKNGQSIDSVESWFEFAPPKEGARQWVDQRSAKELAKAFCGSVVAVPRELLALLNSNPTLGPIDIVDAWPEHKIALDSFRGETRNADLAAIANGRDGTVSVTVEAKADESFGELIRSVLAGPREKSNVPARVEALARGLFGGSGEEISDLRYQLLHAAAASLIFAAEHQATAAVFAVFEFCGPSCSQENLRRNKQDLERLLVLLGQPGGTFQDGQLFGPFAVPGSGRIPGTIPLFVGKTIREVGQRAV